MRKLIYFILIFPFLSIAQVGVNTTTPNAALDIESADNGLLIPRVQLINALDITTVVNPAGGTLANSTLIYNMAASGVAPNEVASGFYYWNGTRWLPIAGNAADHDWYEQGTATAPNAITDNMFHTGNVAIGKNTANSTLDLQTTDQNVGISNALVKNATMGTSYGFDNAMTINSNDNAHGIRNSFFGAGTGLKVGIKTIAGTSILGSKIGIDNDLYANGNNYMFGIRNTLNHTGTGETLGVVNYITHPVGATGTSHGFENRIDNNSAFETTGLYNIVSSTTGGSGGSYGILNFIGGRKTGGKIGTANILSTDINIPDDLIGTQNFIASNTNISGNPSTIYGTQNNLEANGNTSSFGSYNILYGSGTGNLEGFANVINNSGNGTHIGNRNDLSGTGNGIKYGIQNSISTTAGGTHYGIHSTVLKPGSNNFAGYFLGNVGIGTTAANTYTFPSSRGANGQIMQTDGSGNVSWQNPGNSAWALNGNAGTNPPFLMGNTFAANEDFIGTSDPNPLFFGTNNISRMQISANGNVGIGVDIPIAKLHIFEPVFVSNPSLYIQKMSYTSGLGTLVVNTTYSDTGANTFHNAEFNANGIHNGTNIAARFSATEAVNNYAIIVSPNNGDVGFGTNTPTTKLHVVKPTAGAFRIEDGTQANGNVFRSDANGVGTWQNPNTFSWSLTGNTVNAATNFIGSTNNANVMFRRNNAYAGYIGQFNTALGINALPVTSGVYNTAFGVNALAGLGAADQNCAFGWNALSNVTTGGNNIGIGTGAQVPLPNANNQIRMGNANIAYAGIQVAWSVTSDSRWKEGIKNTHLGLDFIDRLRPVSYFRKNDTFQKTEYGFIAQELDQTLTEFGAANNGIITKDNEGMLSVRYNDLLAPMVKAIQELKSQNEALLEQNQQLERRLKTIEAKLNQ